MIYQTGFLQEKMLEIGKYWSPKLAYKRICVILHVYQKEGVFLAILEVESAKTCDQIWQRSVRHTESEVRCADVYKI